jgi:ABC-2 type transport system ATP-binding protein
VLTTHVMEEVERYAARLVIMDEGHVVEQDEPADVCERHGLVDLEEVFTSVTGHGIYEHRGGRLRDVRAQRRTARRLG